MRAIDRLRRVTGALILVQALLCESPSFAQSIILPSGSPSSAQSGDSQSAADSIAQLKAKWLEFERSANSQTSTACAGPQTPVASLSQKLIYRGGSVVGSATSPNGIVALADLSKEQIVTYPEGIDRPPGPPTFLGGAFQKGSILLSNDGHFLAWSDGFRDHIFDVLAGRPILQLDFMIAGQQWIGDDLVVEPSEFPGPKPSPRHNSLLLMKREGDSFRETVLTSKLFPTDEFGLVDSVSAFAREAKGDQLGQSFISKKRVYSSIAEALADGAIPQPYPAVFELRTFRLGSFLLRVNLFETAEELQAHKQATWSLNLLNGSGTEMASRTLPQPLCRPREIAVAPDGKTFAMLVGWETVFIVDSHDLAYKAVYNLLSVPGTAPTPETLALLPDGRILATTDEALVVYDPKAAK